MTERSSQVLLSRGGHAYIEFLFVLPLLAIFFIGIVQLGRQFSQIAWFSTVNYETALAGGQANSDAGPSVMVETFNRLYDIHKRNNNDRIQSSAPTNNQPPEYVESNRTVNVNYTAVARPILKALQLDFNINYVGPMLLSDPNLSEGNLNAFENDRNFCYDCYGVPTNCPANDKCSDLPLPPPPPPGGGHCFAAETPITLASGEQVEISLIKVGDKVMAYDVVSGKQVQSVVSNLMQHEVQGYYILNEHIKVTAEHPFYVAGKWIPVKELKIGDKFLSINGSAVALRSKGFVDKTLQVFNLTVDSYHNYFAAGLLVHNKTGLIFQQQP